MYKLPKISGLGLEYSIIAVAVVIKLILQLVATVNSGYHGDELLHIEAGKHVAFGYMDFPPLIGLLAWLQNLFQSDSIFINHVFNYINSAFILIFCGFTTIKLGGKSKAVLITMLCILFSPGFGASQYLFLPTAFDQLFWIVFIYLSICYTKSFDSKFLFYSSIAAAVGFLNKYSIAFLVAGFFFSAILFQKELLRKRYNWFSVLVFIIIILPNIIWQIYNGYPVFHHVSELYRTQLNNQSSINEFKNLIQFLNPFTFIIWFTALIFLPFIKTGKISGLPLYTLVFSFLLIFLAKGKSYYYYPIILGLISFGSVFYEKLMQNKNIFLFVYLSIVSVSGILMLPHGLPLLNLKTYIKAYNLKPNEDNKIPLAFENFYAKENWNRILNEVNNIYSKLSNEEKKKCLVWGRHYSMAGGINLLGFEYRLPQAFSFHSSFYKWVPEFSKDVIIIAISESNWKKPQWERYFTEVEEVKIIENQFASEPNWYDYRIFLCKNLKYNSSELMSIFKTEIF